MTVTRMTNSEVLINFIQNHVKEFDTAESGLEALRMLTGAIDKRINMFDELSEVFKKYDMMENWVECPRCISLVLLNYKDCNICDFPLLGAVEEKPKTTLEKVKKLTPSGKSVVAEPTHDEDGVEYEDEEEVVKPKKDKKVKKTKEVKSVDEAKPKKVKKVVKPVKVEVEELEDDVPDDDEVKEMGKRELAILIEKEELDINVKKDYKGRSIEVLNDLRDAVCEELDEKYGEEEEFEPEEEVVKPKKVTKSKKVATKKSKEVEPEEDEDEYGLGEFGFGDDEDEEDD